MLRTIFSLYQLNQKIQTLKKKCYETLLQNFLSIILFKIMLHTILLNLLLRETGPPESVKSCTVSNQSISFLLVECEPGYDGGMRQTYHLEVYNSAVDHLQANVSSQDAPVFQVSNLPSATSFILVLYASNSKGKSNSVALMANTLMPAERRTDKDTSNCKYTFFSYNLIIMHLFL